MTALERPKFEINRESKNCDQSPTQTVAFCSDMHAASVVRPRRVPANDLVSFRIQQSKTNCTISTVITLLLNDLTVCLDCRFPTCFGTCTGNRIGFIIGPM